MKNILFATTALVATAGIASAEVTGSGSGTINITGSAEMGIVGGTDLTSQFHTDIDLSFAMTGTADNGLTFGGTVDLDENGAFDAAKQGGETIFVSFGGATLTMGDTDGAFDKALREVNYAGGSINDAETDHAGFSGNGGFNLKANDPTVGTGFDGMYDGQIARFDYAFEGFTGSLSVEIDDKGNADPAWGVGVAYSGNMGGVTLGIGLGFQATENADTTNSNAGNDGQVWGVSVDAGFSNGLTVGINHSQASGEHLDDLATDIGVADGVLAHTGVGIGYSMNAVAIGVNYGHYVLDDEELASGFGIAATYDLGGGLSAQFGYGSSSLGGDFARAHPELNDVYDLFSMGLAMSF